MTILEKTFWDMIKNCISFLFANSIVWKGVEVIEADVNDLVLTEKKLAEASKTQSGTQTEGHVVLKNTEIEDLGKPIYRLSCSLSHLARKSKNPVLLKIVNFSETALTAGEEREILSRFGAILDAAAAYIKDLAKYKFTDNDLTALKLKYEKLTTLPNAINLVSGAHKSATRIIKESIPQARLILEDLDDLFEGMVTDQIFIDGWFDVRKIKGRPSGGKKGNGSSPEDVPPVK